MKTDRQDGRPAGAAADARVLEERLGVDFRDKSLLMRAVTHSSYAMEHELPRTSCNERLEFLGDAFFDAIIGEALYERLPEEEEGRLTKLRAQIVCEESLRQVGTALGIGEVLRLGRGEEISGGRARKSLIADATEALIGALYLDQGYETVKQTVRRLFAAQMEAALAGRLTGDYKSAFQERMQSLGRGAITYQVIREDGPDHAKTFYTQVLVDGVAAGTGSGHSKKESEQQAAKDALTEAREGFPGER